MPQVYGIPRGRVADIPGAVSRGTQFKLQKDAISEQQKQQNTQWLAGAAKYGLDNWGQEGVLEQLIAEGQRRGILGPQMNAAELTRGGRGELVKVYKGAMTALGGEQGLMQQNTGLPTAAERNYQERQRLVDEYGEDSDRVKTFDRYVRANRVVEVGGVQTEITPTGDRPLGTLEDEATAAETTAGATARGSAKERGRVERLNKAIDEGQAAADGLASINRGIQLLDDVSTGKPQQAALWVKRNLGIETGDEGEISNLLGKAVLSQLRATFGAQFTVEEGNRLARIEANFGKNVATNMRLLSNARDIAMRVAERGRRAALEVGDPYTVQSIQDAMNFTLGGEQNELQPGADGFYTVTGDEDFDLLPIGAKYRGPDGVPRTK